jgi:transposase
MSEQKTTIRYSAAFKQKVVSEIESGKLTIAKAQKIYDIKGGQTIQAWIKKLGKNQLLSKIVRVEMKDEHDKIKALERQKQQLESALAQAHLTIICLESVIECVDEHYGIDVKKNFGTPVQQELLAKSTNNR